jgi:hypothetical protein
VTRSWIFREPANARIQNRVTRFPQKTRGSDDTEEGMMSESGSQFVYGEGAGANSFIPMCPVVTSKSIVNVY